MFVRLPFALVAVLTLGSATARGAGEAELRTRAEALARRYGPKGFTVVVEPPFVVIGDERPATVEARAHDFVRTSVAALEAQLFATRPEQVLEIWLFRDRRSYLKHAREIFGEKPTTPFGWYSPEHGALIMDIHTGGGTLRHELVHPFVEADFPAAPAWLNEGLGSLYEGATVRDGRLVGLPNWRLPGLKEAIRARTLPGFRTLLGTSTEEFYQMEAGYAQARYLCLWLQDRGLLVDFYRKLRGGAAAVETLTAMVGGDLDAFQRRWQAWVMRIRWP